MARRLNTLLHEMKLGPTAQMTTKDQLEALFRAEIDRMTDHLDSLVFAARRAGSDPRDSLRADLEVGWAYRLIQLYGTMRQPDFGENCPARARLLKDGIPESMIPAIADTFRQEQAACRSRAFEATLVEDMKRHGIEDTLVNREKAIMELMRAKADVLLDTAGRYSEPGLQPPFDAETQVNDRSKNPSLAEGAPTVQSPRPDPDERFSARPEHAAGNKDAFSKTADRPEIERQHALELPPRPHCETAPGQSRDGFKGEICPVSQLDDLMERYAESRVHEVDEGRRPDIDDDRHGGARDLFFEHRAAGFRRMAGEQRLLAGAAARLFCRAVGGQPVHRQTGRADDFHSVGHGIGSGHGSLLGNLAPRAPMPIDRGQADGCVSVACRGQSRQSSNQYWRCHDHINNTRDIQARTKSYAAVPDAAALERLRSVKTQNTRFAGWSRNAVRCGRTGENKACPGWCGSMLCVGCISAFGATSRGGGSKPAESEYPRGFRELHVQGRSSALSRPRNLQESRLSRQRDRVFRTSQGVSHLGRSRSLPLLAV